MAVLETKLSTDTVPVIIDRFGGDAEHIRDLLRRMTVFDTLRHPDLLGGEIEISLVDPVQEGRDDPVDSHFKGVETIPQGRG